MSGNRFGGLTEHTDIPVARNVRLFVARLKYPSTFTVYPTPKFSGRRADICVWDASVMPQDNTVLDVDDEEKQVALQGRSDGVFTASV